MHGSSKVTETICIYVAEEPKQVAVGTTLFQLRAQQAPDADITVLNGFPVSADQPLRADDRVVFITRGKLPTQDSLEALLVARHSPGVHEKLKRASVGIAGVGGLGSTVAIALARSGIGTLHLVDYDVVEPSNINRQQYFIDQIGLPKVIALREILKRINPYVRVQSSAVRITPKNLEALWGEVDVLVEALDAADEKAMLVHAFSALRPHTPIVLASGVAGYESGNSIATRAVGKSLVVVGDQRTEAAPQMGLMAPRVGIAAHHQANAVLRLLLGLPPA